MRHKSTKLLNPIIQGVSIYNEKTSKAHGPIVLINDIIYQIYNRKYQQRNFHYISR